MMKSFHISLLFGYEKLVLAVIMVFILAACATPNPPSFYKLLPSGDWIIDLGQDRSPHKPELDRTGLVLAAQHAKSIGCKRFVYRVDSDDSANLDRYVRYTCVDKTDISSNPIWAAYIENTDDILSRYAE